MIKATITLPDGESSFCMFDKKDVYARQEFQACVDLLVKGIGKVTVKFEEVLGEPSI